MSRTAASTASLSERLALRELRDGAGSVSRTAFGNVVDVYAGIDPCLASTSTVSRPQCVRSVASHADVSTSPTISAIEALDLMLVRSVDDSLCASVGVVLCEE
jgi:hypothetical protein